MERKYYYLGCILLALLLLVFFYPKDCGRSYGGLVKVGETLEREECDCLGFKASSYGSETDLLNPIVRVGCSDCAKNYYCFGLPLNKNCYQWVADGSHNYSSERKVECDERWKR